MPDKYTCDGPNVSPPLKISGIPDGTVSLVLRFTDEDYPFEHWILYDIPLISEIKADSVPTGAHQGPNGRGDNTYRGPCGKYHVYRFYLYAIDKKLGYGNGVEWGQINDAISGHILKSTTLTTDDSKRS